MRLDALSPDPALPVPDPKGQPTVRALLSVSDKTGLVPFAQALAVARMGTRVHRRYREGAARRPD